MNEIKRSRIRPLLLAAVAGFVTLAFQILCARLLIQHFGIGTSAIASMVATSLAGLAAGSFFFGHHADRFHYPIRTVGFLFAVTSVAIFVVVNIHFAVASGIDSLFEPNVSRLATHQIAFCLTLAFPINFLLGGLLPILVSHSSDNSHSNVFAQIYACETAGAMLGALASGFLLIQSIGVSNSLHAVAGLALFSAATCLTNWTRRNRQNNDSRKDLADSPRLSTLFLLVVFLASVASLAMEIIWQRYFVILFGSDTHSLAIVTASFLLGISLGAWLAPVIIRRFSYTRQLYSTGLITISFSILFSTLLLISLVDGKLSALVLQTDLISDYPVTARFLIAGIAMLLPATTLGVALPVAAAYWMDSEATAGQRIGQLYGVAIVGNVGGIILVGFFLIPLIGLSKSAILLSALCLAGSLGIYFVTSPVQSTERSKLLQATSILAFAGWCGCAYLVLNHSLFLGIHSSDNIQVEFYDEGSDSSVAVVSSTDNPNNKRMLIDGVAIGESGGGVDEKQQLLAHLPFLLRPELDKQNVLTIGLGSGILAGKLVEHSAVNHVTCVEVLPPVIKAAEYFADSNSNVLANERLAVVQADGIRFLRVNEDPYDVIISDAKSRPGHSGNVAFFTEDYYKLCESRLSEDGMFIQWVGLNTSRDAIKVILNSFCGKFPYGHIAVAAPNDIFVVGTKQPIKFDENNIQALLANNLTSSLKQYHWNTYHDLISMYWLDQTTIAQSFVFDAGVNSFDRPCLEAFSLANFKNEPTQPPGNVQLKMMAELFQFDIASDVENSRFNSNSISHLPENRASELIAGRMAASLLVEAGIVMTELKEGWLDNAATLFAESRKHLPNLTRQQKIADIYRQIVSKAATTNQLNKEFSALDAISDLGASTAEEEFRLAEILTELNKNEAALEYFYRAATKAPAQPQYRCEFGFCLFQLHRIDQAKVQFERALKEFPDHAAAKLGQGICMLKSSRQKQAAKRKIRSAVSKDPTLQNKLEKLGIDLDFN